MGDSIELDTTKCATVSLAEAAKVIGVHRSTAWELWRRGEFPVPVLQIGARLRISKVHLARFLEGDPCCEIREGTQSRGESESGDHHSGSCTTL